MRIEFDREDTVRHARTIKVGEPIVVQSKAFGPSDDLGNLEHDCAQYTPVDIAYHMDRIRNPPVFDPEI
jgi:hypothetical protein